MYAVIDTNGFVSALITKNPESPTRLVYDFIDNGEMIPKLILLGLELRGFDLDNNLNLDS